MVNVVIKHDKHAFTACQCCPLPRVETVGASSRLTDSENLVALYTCFPLAPPVIPKAPTPNSRYTCPNVFSLHYLVQGWMR